MTVRQDVAVVLCTYNGARHVSEQMDSILAQHTLPGQIRVHDDGSSDDTVNIIRTAWSSRTSSAAEVALHVADRGTPVGGAAGNFARAMVAAPQPILVLADQDDLWMPTRIGSTLAALDSEPSLELVASDAEMVDGAGTPVGRTVLEAQRLTRRERDQLRDDDCLPALLRRNLVPGMTFTLRRSLVERLGPLPAGAMHDYWLAAAAAAAGTARILPQPLVRYRIHGANTIGLDTGGRRPVERVVIKARGFRAPLTDLPQWTELPGRLAAAGDVDAAARLQDKRRFEVARRHGEGRWISRLRSTGALLASDDYLRYDFQGRKAGLRDLIRRRDPHLVSGAASTPATAS